MSRPFKKSIACLESLWDENVEDKLTVAPVLQLISSRNKIKFTHLACNTKGELEFNLGSLPRRRAYQILYLAFHGSPGEIWLRDGTCISIEELAALMATKFAGWVVHFGTCGTLDTDRARLSTFCRQTEVALMLGYRKDVDWIDSAAMDLILLDWLENYRALAPMWRRVAVDYRELVGKTGLTVYPEVRS